MPRTRCATSRYASISTNTEQFSKPEDYAVEWASSGPPHDARYQAETETWFCDVPGTPVVVEFAMAKHTVPPAARILEYHWNPTRSV